MATTTQTIFPTLRFRDAPRMIRWLGEAFGIERNAVYDGPNVTVAHAQLTFGPSMLMCGSAPAAGSADDLELSPGAAGLYLVVDDDAAVDAHCARARAAGAEIVREPADQDYGGRGYSARDPEDNVWSFGSYRPEV
jgi:uncharacterized glyoxalase superfamily protein PhnB